MTPKLNTAQPTPAKPAFNSDLPFLSPQQVEKMTGGAITSGYLKTDRYEAEANGTLPKIPYYRFGYRTIRYKPDDLQSFIESNRVG